MSEFEVRQPEAGALVTPTGLHEPADVVLPELTADFSPPAQTPTPPAEAAESAGRLRPPLAPELQVYGALIDNGIRRINDYGHDTVDSGRAQAAADVLGWNTVLPGGFSLLAVASAFSLKDPSVALAAVPTGVAMLPMLFNSHRLSQEAKSFPEHHPAGVYQNMTLESLRVNDTDDISEDGLWEGDIVLLAVPRAVDAQVENLQPLAELARHVEVDALVIPDETGSRTLAEFVDNIKPGRHDMPKFLRDMPVRVLDADEIDTAAGETAESRARQLLDVLARRYPEIGRQTHDLSSARGVERVAHALRRHIAASVQHGLTSETIATKTDHGVPGRQQVNPYATLAPHRPGEDVFDPVIQISTAGGALPPHKYALSQLSLPDEAARVKLALRNPALAGNGAAVPLLKQTYESLRTVHDQLGQPDKTATTVQPFETADRQVTRHRGPWEAIRMRNKTLGRVAAASMVAFTLALGGIQEFDIGADTAASTSQQTEGRIGRAAPGEGAPIWRAFDQGLPVSGHYADNRLYDLGGDLVWRRTEMGATTTSELPRHTDAPNITVDGYVNVEAGRPVALPVRDGTAVAAVTAELPEGGPIAAATSRTDDNVTGLLLDNLAYTGPAHIEYQLTPAAPAPLLPDRVRVDGVLTPHLGAAAPPLDVAAEATDRIHDSYRYDNTAALDDVTGGTLSPIDFQEHFNAHSITNCNTAATEVAIEQYERDSRQTTAYTTGFLVEGDGMMSQAHAWITDRAGQTLDPTPSLRPDQTPESVGLPKTDPAELAQAWEDRRRNFADGSPLGWPDLPWRQLSLSGLALMGVASQADSWRRRIEQLRESLATRHMSRRQAGNLLAHAAYGDPERPASTADLLNYQEDAEPVAIAADLLERAEQAPQTIASNLSDQQAKSLGRIARRLRRERGDRTDFAGTEI